MPAPMWRLDTTGKLLTMLSEMHNLCWPL